MIPVPFSFFHDYSLNRVTMENILLKNFSQWEKETPDRIFLRQPIKGQWQEWSFRKAGDEIKKNRCGPSVAKLASPEQHCHPL